MRQQVAVAMLGARMHYAVPVLLEEAGLLDRLFTDSYAGNKPRLASVLRRVPGGPFRKEISRWLGRAEPRLPPERVVSFERLGLRYALALRRARSRDAEERVFTDTGRRFSKAVLRHGLGEAAAVWGFNTASLELLEAARAEGRRCLLEQTILPGRLADRLLRQEAEHWPGWQPELKDSGQPLLREREEAEWALAHRIVVGSPFVAEGLAACGVPPAKVRVIPYGVDLARFPALSRPSAEAPGPLRVAFVGEVGLRKGAPYLLEALARLGPERVTARLAGRVAIAPERLEPFRDVAEFLGPVPRPMVPEILQWAQVLVLPSIVEGSATSTYEALLSGLPVVTTPNSGTIVREETDGRIVPIRDADAIAEALRAYIDDPDLRGRHAAEARASRDRAGLDRYGQELVRLVREELEA